MAAYEVDGMRFGTEGDAINYVELNGQTRDSTTDTWTVPEQYIGPMYDTVVTVEYVLPDGVPVQVRYLFTDSQIAGKDPEEYPWDAADAELVVDDVHVVEAA